MSRNGFLKRLVGIPKEHLYQIFCITNSAFAALIIKMAAHSIANENCSFRLLSPEIQRAQLYEKSQILETLSNLFFVSSESSRKFDAQSEPPANPSSKKGGKVI